MLITIILVALVMGALFGIMRWASKPYVRPNEIIVMNSDFTIYRQSKGINREIDIRKHK